MLYIHKSSVIGDHRMPWIAWRPSVQAGAADRRNLVGGWLVAVIRSVGGRSIKLKMVVHEDVFAVDLLVHGGGS